MTGKEYIEGSCIKELDYDEAKELCKKALIDFLSINNNRLTYGNLIDNPIYPLNIELYDEFCDIVNGESDFYEEGFIGWLVKLINRYDVEYRIDEEWDEASDDTMLCLRGLTDDEKEELEWR